MAGPSTYELRWPNVPPLSLMTEGGRPSGWVNPAAYGFTFGIDLNTGATSVYLYTPRS